MARRHYQVGQDVASETESDGVGQRNLEEVDETGIGHLQALSPWLLMMMMNQNWLQSYSVTGYGSVSIRVQNMTLYLHHELKLWT